jgi:hypothetical protein
MRQDYHRNLRVMDDQELERFVKDWLERKTSQYRGVQRFGGASDLGRDVVGYLSDSRMSGPWDNYQCKQLLSAIDLASGARELGKIFWHASRGEYAMPERYAFVAPSGIKRDLEAMIAKPAAFKAAMLVNWDKWCRKGIAAPGVDTSLSDGIRALVSGWDFARVMSFDAHAIVDDPDVTAVLVEWFGYDPGKAPRGVVPVDFQPEETDFSAHLLEVYRQNAGIPFADLGEVLTHAKHGPHLGRQRRWFFDAASFRRFYRDNTPTSYLVSFDQDMHDGVIDVYERVHADRLDRLNAVMSHAGTVKPSGILGHHSEVGVRQGTCHHFVNEGRLSWRA